MKSLILSMVSLFVLTFFSGFVWAAAPGVDPNLARHEDGSASSYVGVSPDKKFCSCQISPARMLENTNPEVVSQSDTTPSTSKSGKKQN